MPRVAAVTGASGMVGTHVVDRLLQQGWTVRVLSRGGKATREGVVGIEGDLTTEASLLRLLAGADVVFHCAAELHDARVMHRVNVEGTKLLARCAADEGVQVFCHLSSVGVFGPISKGIWVDESFPCSPVGDYETSKWQAEQVLLEYREHMRVCMLRPTNVVDDKRPGILAMPLRNGWWDRLMCFVKGSECAHVIHASDVADAALHLIHHPECSGVYIVGCDEDERNTVAGVYGLARQLLGDRAVSARHLPASIPYLIRKAMRGTALHGQARFSSARLMSAGFSLPLGLEGAIARVCHAYGEGCS